MVKICCIKGCGNSDIKRGFFKREEWLEMPCDTRDSEGKFTLFCFPINSRQDERKKWVRMVNREEIGRGGKAKAWEPKKYSRICSRHFEEGEPTAEHPYPVKNLGYRPHRMPKSPRAKVRKVYAAARNRARLVTDGNFPNGRIELPGPASLPISTSPSPDDEDILDVIERGGEHNYSKKLTSEVIDRLISEVRSLRQRVCSPEALLTNDKRTRFYTGLPSLELFKALVESVSQLSDEARIYSQLPAERAPGERKLDCASRCLVVLMRNRLGLLVQHLADMFDVSCTMITYVYRSYLPLIAEVLKPLIRFIKKIPSDTFSAKNSSNVISVIDCTEIFIETPRNPTASLATYGQYKIHNTCKILASIDQYGAFNFKSMAWGGRASDNVIAKEGEFLDSTYFNGKTVFADKGFSIHYDLALRGGKLVIPPGRSGKNQFSKEEVVNSETVSRLRIFVEKAFARLKTFIVLDGDVPIQCLDLIDDLITCCMGICNLYSPLAC